MRRRGGFTILEVMIAVMLVVVPLLALVSVQIYMTGAGAQDEMRATASALAYSELNRIETTLKAQFSTNVARPAGPVAGNPDYTMTITENLVNPDLKEVRVTVTWSDEVGPHEYELWTYVVETT